MLDFAFENNCNKTVCGVDEVGRGPWAGPVIACCVVIKNKYLPQNILQIIDDSKKLSRKKLYFLNENLKPYCHFAFGEASVEEIDQINILNASLLAMKRAVEKMNVPIHMALIYTF